MITWMHECELEYDQTKKYDEDQYPFLIQELMVYIEKLKKTDRDLSLIDIIVNYALKNEIDVEVIGDAISNDIYFKSFIKKDCELHEIQRTKEEDW